MTPPQPMMATSAAYWLVNGLYQPTPRMVHNRSVWLNSANCSIEYNDESWVGWLFACRGHIRYVSGCHNELASRCSFVLQRGFGSWPAPTLDLRPDAIDAKPTVGRNCTVLPSRAISVDLPPLTAPRVGRRTIWMFWAQGWTEAPDLVRTCALSWARRNPEWIVRRLSLTDLLQYGVDLQRVYANLPHPYSPHYSDLVRTELLTLHGGLWVDSTILCLRPVEQWLPALAVPIRNEAGTAAARAPLAGGWEAGTSDASALTFYGVRYNATSRNSARGHGLLPRQISNYLLYARGAAHPTLLLLRHNLRLFWYVDACGGGCMRWWLHAAGIACGARVRCEVQNPISRLGSRWTSFWVVQGRPPQHLDH